APIAPLTWSRRVLLPLQARDWPVARLRDVLLHEFCHVARRDSLTQLMAAVVRAAFWFSPAVWLALRELRFEQEHACDERVVECGAEAVAYAQTLVDVAATSHPGPLEAAVSTAMVHHSSLERRVATILHRGPARPIGGAWMALISASLLLAGLAVATAHPIDPSRRLGPLVPLDTTLQAPRDLWIWRDLDQRLKFATPRSVQVSRDEIEATDAVSLGAALGLTRSGASRGVVINRRACVFVNGVARPGYPVDAIDAGDVEFVEAYPPGSDLTRTLALRWPPGATCGVPDGTIQAHSAGARQVVQFVAVWLRAP
ncbi:MAG: M56 family metallopeptidase, partial [Candidatus Eisenbacteria bacterium]